MSGENVEALRAVYDRWSEGDLRPSLDLLDPHVVFVHDPQLETWEVAYGVEEVVAYTREMLKSWAEFRMEAGEIIASGDSVIVEVHQRGVGSGSGVPAEIDYFHIWTFRGRKVVRFESMRERAKALETVGSSD